MKRKKTDVLGAQVPAPWMRTPPDVDVEFTFWQLLDEVGSWFLQGAAVVGGGPYGATLDPLDGSITITSSGIEVFFPMWGSVLDVQGSNSISVPTGDQVILIPDLEYPIRTSPVAYTVLPAGEDVRKKGQFCLFLGGRRGNTVYMRPDTVITP